MLLHRDASRNTGHVRCIRIILVISGQDGGVGATKAVTADVHRDVGGKVFGTRADIQTTSLAATATVMQAPRKRFAPGGGLGRPLSVLYVLGYSYGLSRLSSPTTPAVLRGVDARQVESELPRFAIGAAKAS